MGAGMYQIYPSTAPQPGQLFLIVSIIKIRFTLRIYLKYMIIIMLKSSSSRTSTGMSR